MTSMKNNIPPDEQENAVKDLLYRLLPAQAWQFEIAIKPSLVQGRDFVRVTYFLNSKKQWLTIEV